MNGPTTNPLLTAAAPPGPFEVKVLHYFVAIFTRFPWKQKKGAVGSRCCFKIKTGQMMHRSPSSWKHVDRDNQREQKTVWCRRVWWFFRSVFAEWRSFSSPSAILPAALEAKSQRTTPGDKTGDVKGTTGAWLCTFNAHKLNREKKKKKKNCTRRPR